MSKFTDSPLRTRLGMVAALLGLPAFSSVASAYDLFTQSAAVDQPRINFAVARAATPNTPLEGENFFGDPSIYLQGFYDTGASGTLLAGTIADVLEIERQMFNGQLVVFGDSSPNGIVPFNVSEPLVIRLADNWGTYDTGLVGNGSREVALDDPANFLTLYDHRFGPLRSQISIGESNPFIGDLNVIGMPAMQKRTVVMDMRPTNNFFTLLDGDPNNDNFDVQIYTFVYANAEEGRRRRRNRNSNIFDPGPIIPEVRIKLSYADFSAFTTLTPAGAAPPTLADNPFIGPNPVLNDPNDTTPPVTVKMGANSSDGSWLLDTGAAASFISLKKAKADLGIDYDPNHPIGSATPRLTGVPLSRQFTIQISGIDGEILTIAGFFVDNLLVRTMEGNAANDNDPKHLNYLGTGVIVFDIDVFDPVANRTITLDGIFGVNNLAASANIIPDIFFPIILDPTPAPAAYVIFNEPLGWLGLNFTGRLREWAPANAPQMPDGPLPLIDTNGNLVEMPRIRVPMRLEPLVRQARLRNEN